MVLATEADPPKLGFDTIEAADIECGKRNVKFVRDYLAAGGKPERIVFQSWMTHPTETGPEAVAHSFMGITKRQLDVAAHVTKESE